MNSLIVYSNAPGMTVMISVGSNCIRKCIHCTQTLLSQRLGEIQKNMICFGWYLLFCLDSLYLFFALFMLDAQWSRTSLLSYLQHLCSSIRWDQRVLMRILDFDLSPSVNSITWKPLCGVTYSPVRFPWGNNVSSRGRSFAVIPLISRLMKGSCIVDNMRGHSNPNAVSFAPWKAPLLCVTKLLPVKTSFQRLRPPTGKTQIRKVLTRRGGQFS